MKLNGPWTLLTLALALALSAQANAQQKNLVYNTVPACTVVDTRVAGGAIPPSATRTYNVVGSGSLASQGGSATGCGIPGFSNGVAQVQAVELYVTAVNPTASGFIDAYAADQAFSNSVLNFQAGWAAIADSATVAVAQSPGIGDFKVTLCCSTIDLVVRVVGYYTKPVQTIVLNSVPGDAVASGTALINALASISDASATKPYVVRLGPGVYDVGDTRLQMKAFVDLEGSGQQATILQGNGNNGSDLTNGVVLGANSMELRNLQVKCNGTSARPIAIAIYNPGTSPRMTHVTVVSGGSVSSNWGIRNGSASPTIEDSTINVSGGPVAYGISNVGSSTPTIRRTVITVTNSTAGTGIYNDGFSLAKEARDVEIDVSGGSTAIAVDINQFDQSVSGTIVGSTFKAHGATSATYGIRIVSSSPVLEIKTSDITATGGGTSYGIYNQGGTLRVDHSEIAGDTNSAYNIGLGPMQIGASRLARPTFGTTCAGVYDQNLVFYTNTCP